MELPPKVSGFQIHFGFVLGRLQDFRRSTPDHRRFWGAYYLHIWTGICWLPWRKGDSWEQRGSRKHATVMSDVSRSGGGNISPESHRYFARFREAPHRLQRINLLRTTLSPGWRIKGRSVTTFLPFSGCVVLKFWYLTGELRVFNIRVQTASRHVPSVGGVYRHAAWEDAANVEAGPDWFLMMKRSSRSAGFLQSDESGR